MEATMTGRFAAPWLSPSRWPLLLVVLMMAASAVAVAFLSVGLIAIAMANVNFLLTYRLMAVLEGGLLQSALLALRGALLLAAILCFKVAETELVDRWRGLARRPPAPPPAPEPFAPSSSDPLS
jgi:hypothetical protein